MRSRRWSVRQLVRSQDAERITVISADDRFNLVRRFHALQGHRRYYGK